LRRRTFPISFPFWWSRSPTPNFSSSIIELLHKYHNYTQKDRNTKPICPSTGGFLGFRVQRTRSQWLPSGWPIVCQPFNPFTSIIMLHSHLMNVKSVLNENLGGILGGTQC
jgi:hypothetical protein